MLRPFFALLALCSALLFASGCAPKRTFAGDWSGAISLPNPMTGSTVNVHLVIHVVQQDGGEYLATLDSPDQKVTGIKLDSFTVKDNDISTSLNMGQVKASYTGKSNAEATKITGTWSQGGMSIPLEFNKDTEKQATPGK